MNKPRLATLEKDVPTENCRFKFKDDNDPVAAARPEFAAESGVYNDKFSCVTSIPKPVWNLHIGGYQPVQKWLLSAGPRGLFR
jgi:hypothetical protein